MIDQETVKQIQQASVTERIQLIELILESLKHDMATQPAGEKLSFKRFKAPQFNLGREVHGDRELIYAARGI